MNKQLIFVIALLSVGNLSHAQQTGFLKFSDLQTWVVQIGDSVISSDKVHSFEAGTYPLKARPEISYSWPGIFVEDEIFISANDTVFYSLGKNISVIENNINPPIVSNVSYSNKDFVTTLKENINFKNGMILGAVASNWLSFYLKRLADSHYKKYRNASSTHNINKYKNNFKDYDLYSQITLGISSALLSGYIYISLTE